MKLIIDINKDYIIEKLKNGIVNLVFYIYSWFTHEGEILGYILAVFHILIGTTIFLFILICHTIYPDFWLQVVVFICLFCIWLHHVTLNVCIVILAEKVLTKNVSPFVEMLQSLLSQYNISLEQFGLYFMIAETVGVLAFALELISRMSIYVQRYFTKNTI